MTTKPIRYKTGDRVICNGRNPNFTGRKGTVKYETGGLHFIKFDDTGQTSTVGLPNWALEPLPAGQ
jgi:hypothetical protein